MRKVVCLVEIKPIFNKIIESGSKWFSQVIRATDHSISIILNEVQKNKKRAQEYLRSREVLLASLKEVQKKMDFKTEENEAMKQMYAERLFELYEKLDLITNEVINRQKNIDELGNDVSESKETIEKLNLEKMRFMNERNFLRSEYDHLQVIIEQNLKQKSALEQELNLLKKSSQVHTNSKIAELTQAIESLSDENQKNKENLENRKVELVEKMKQISVNNQLLISSQKELSIKEEVIQSLKVDLEQSLNMQHLFLDERTQLKLEMQKQHQLIEENRLELDMISNEKAMIKNQLDELNEVYMTDLEAAESEVNSLKEKLTNEQNNLAIEMEENGSPQKLDAETLRILEQEYEPRFNTLYTDCVISREFYSDFFSLIPSDRLKVEACIVNLNYHYERSMAKVRPNSVQSKSGFTINEYPFGSDHIGRIYFKRTNGKINFYRISRTKNGKGHLDQKRVIAWLQKNY